MEVFKLCLFYNQLSGGVYFGGPFIEKGCCLMRYGICGSFLVHLPFDCGTIVVIRWDC